MVIRKPAAAKTATKTRSTITEKKAAVPVRPTRKAPAAKPAAKKAAVASKPEKEYGPRPGVPTAHDVLRAEHTARLAQQQYEELRDAYHAAYIQELDEVAADERVIPLAGRPKNGRPAHDGPLRAARAVPAKAVADEIFDEDKVRAMPLSKLRELAAQLASRGIITETKIKLEILDQMEEAGLFREAGDQDADEDDEQVGDAEDVEEDEESDADEDDDDEDGEEDLDEVEVEREDLLKMNLKQLQDLAEDNKIKWRGLGKDELVDALIPPDEEEEDDEEGEDEEEEEEDGELEIDPDDLPNMDLDELLGICAQIGQKVPASKRGSKKAVIALIMQNVE